MKYLNKSEIIKLIINNEQQINDEIERLSNKGENSKKIAYGLKTLKSLVESLDEDILRNFDTRLEFYNHQFKGGNDMKFLKRLSNNLRFGSQSPKGLSANSIFALNKMIAE